MVTIRENGEARRGTAEEAFLLKMRKEALEGGGAIALDMLGLLEDLRGLEDHTSEVPFEATLHFVSPGNVNRAAEVLGMAQVLYRLQHSARLMLEPWLVQAALERLGDRRLTRAEQEIVLKATRTPHKVKWPDWWEVLPKRK